MARGEVDVARHKKGGGKSGVGRESGGEREARTASSACQLSSEAGSESMQRRRDMPRGSGGCGESQEWTNQATEVGTA